MAAHEVTENYLYCGKCKANWVSLRTNCIICEADVTNKCKGQRTVLVTDPSPSAVDHPPHYGGAEDPFEHIKVAEAKGWGYHIGNATKYMWRAGLKTPDLLQDLKKAKWYLDRYIELLELKLPQAVPVIKYLEYSSPYANSDGPLCLACNNTVQSADLAVKVTLLTDSHGLEKVTLHTQCYSKFIMMRTKK